MRIGLAFDGGGCRGIITAIIGAHIEAEVGATLPALVDMAYGTSTGGIIALGAGHPSKITMKDMILLYRDQSAAIFGQKRWNGWRGLWRSKYKQSALEDILRDIFGADPLSFLTLPTAVATYGRLRSQPIPLQSWNPKHSHVKITDAALATSAAWPTYFKPVELERLVLIDGGFTCNNPAGFCYADMVDLYPPWEEGKSDDGKQYTVISIGTGEATEPLTREEALQDGLVRNGGTAIETLFDGTTDGYNYILRKIPRIELLRIQTPLHTAAKAMDDTSPKNIQRLTDDTWRYIDSSMEGGGPLVRTIKLLKERRDITRSGKPAEEIKKALGHAH